MTKTPFVDASPDQQEPGKWRWEMYLDEKVIAFGGGCESRVAALIEGRAARVRWLQARGLKRDA